MPELPEVETIRISLKKELIIQRIISTDVRNSALRWPVQEDLYQKINNQFILDVLRRGKVICLRLTEGYLLIHPGMTGKVLIKEHGYVPEKHDHIILKLSDISLVYNDPRRFGYVEWARRIDKTNLRFIQKGPDPFDQDFTLDYLKSRLNNSKTEIKACLMNDKILTGIGNIYANELLFRANIHPGKRSYLLSEKDIEIIFDNILPLLKEAISMGGSTLRDYVDSKGQKGRFQSRHQVYNRYGLPCSVCGDKIEKFVIGSRSTFFCPSCQRI